MVDQALLSPVHWQGSRTQLNRTSPFLPSSASHVALLRRVSSLGPSWAMGQFDVWSEVFHKEVTKLLCCTHTHTPSQNFSQ